MPEQTGTPPKPRLPYKLFKNSPVRPADWRWRRILALSAEKRRPRREDPVNGTGDDHPIHEGFRFWQDYTNCVSERDYEDLAVRWPSLHQAYAIYCEDESPRLRYELQARFLARQQLAEIGQRLGAEVPALDWYEKLFFNVNDRLDNRGYIVNVIFGHEFQNNLRASNLDTLWMFFGYSGGPILLNAIIDQTLTQDHVRSQRQLTDYVTNDIRVATMLKAEIAARTAHVNSNTEVPIIQTFQKYLEIEKLMQTGPDSNDALVDGIMAIMEGVSYMVGNTERAKSTLRAQFGQATLLNGGVELRSVQVLSLTGNKLPDMKEVPSYPVPQNEEDS